MCLNYVFLKKLNICDHITAEPGVTLAHGGQDSSQGPLDQLLSRTSCDDDSLYLHCHCPHVTIRSEIKFKFNSLIIVATFQVLSTMHGW